MPKNPIDHSKTVFYKLVCKDITITDLYVGSTTDFKARKNQHKCSSQNENNKCYNYKVYVFIRDSGGWENWDMILIHRQSCIDGHEAHSIERGYIETLGATLNCNMPTRTRQEYLKTNKDKIRERETLYREENKEHLKEKRVLYTELNRGKITDYNLLYRQANRDKFIEYTLLNRDKSLEYNKINKEKIKEQCAIYQKINGINIKKQRALYRESNNEKIKEQYRLNRELNKDELNKKQRLYRANVKLLGKQPLDELTNIFI